VLNPKGDVVDTKDIESADDAHAWFVDAKADNSELRWRMEVKADDGHWAFFDDSEGDRKQSLLAGDVPLPDRGRVAAGDAQVPGFLDGERRVAAESAALTRGDLGDRPRGAVERDGTVAVQVQPPARLESVVAHVNPRSSG
jgi:hypothetical protein